MKTRNIIGKIFFWSMGMLLTFMVFYPHLLDYFYLTDRVPKKFELFGKDGAILSIAFVFCWGGAKFIKISDSLINKFSKNGNPNE
ncbi:hypothetical protein [Aquimarina sp. 2201CG14-23]|uniref:hypothetical protein n=1 Tax=Aquimarina mycalae TaxID=3040073 RepID=UPI002478136B|nr:hypothetical protein [Aquimarina sp. 2201CG14-23]MDH7444688.1 hypothetical protein [Aquimarina sp. 2201CG14-23]